jgi:hypothetical protein
VGLGDGFQGLIFNGADGLGQWKGQVRIVVRRQLQGKGK